MINFHTISLKAKEIFDTETGLPDSDFIGSPLEVVVRKARSIKFYEGDNASVQLTDGTRFEVFYENDQWSCSHFRTSHTKNNSLRNLDTDALHGPYKDLEEALIDVVSKISYLAAVN